MAKVQGSDAGILTVSDSAVPGIHAIISRWSKFLMFCVPIFIAIRRLTCPAPVPAGKVADGVVFHVGDRLLRHDVCSDGIIHVACVNETAFFARKILATGVRQMPTHNGR